MLQFITHYNDRRGYVEGTQEVLRGGCRWVQLRMKDADDFDFLRAGREIAGMCRDCGATFVLDDRVQLVDTLEADGVHLGLKDMPVAEARKILGPGKIIGATANELGHMLAAAEAGADYIGLGPFRFTATKQQLSPVLGLEGYRRIMAEFRRTSELPVVAIGGITAEDISDLMQTGISGIALSGTLLRAADTAEETKKIINLIRGCLKTNKT